MPKTRQLRAVHSTKVFHEVASGAETDRPRPDMVPSVAKKRRTRQVFEMPAEPPSASQTVSPTVFNFSGADEDFKSTVPDFPEYTL